MANRPTTLADLRRDQGPPRNNNNMRGMNVQDGGGGGGRAPPATGLGMLGGANQQYGRRQDIERPRKQHWGQMWTTTFCPAFSVCSFTCFNIIVQILVYIASLFYTQANSEIGFARWMLWGNQLETLQVFGLRMPYFIRESGEVHRLVLPLYVNLGFAQVVISCLGQLFAGSMLEFKMGAQRMAVFFFLSGISANLFAATASDMYATGAEPALFALLSGLLADYLFNWPVIQGEWCQKVCSFFIYIILLVFGIFFLSSFAQPYTKIFKVLRISFPDSLGFFGGFLFGFPLTWVLLPTATGKFSDAPRSQKILTFVGLIWFIILNVIVISVFITSEPEKYWRIE